MVPHEPAIQCSDMPEVGGHIGPRPEDFRVEEIAKYPFDGSGDHWFVRVQKTARTTPDVARILSRAAGVGPADVGYAGLKDKHAVTTQWFSLPGRSAAPDTWELPPDVVVLDVTRHRNKLRTGHLSGNRFVIRLADVHPDAPARAGAILDQVTQIGLSNFFGAQRFGTRGQNLAEALAWAESDREPRTSRFARKLYPSVLQAEVFNRYAALRLEEPRDRLIEGEVVRLDGSGSLFVVEDPERERQRLLERDIHLTGPMFGPKTRAAAARAHELEHRALSALGLSERARRRVGRLAPGTRRDLLVFLRDAAARRIDEGLEVSFFLPAGTYATQVIRELTRGPFFAERSAFGNERPEPGQPHPPRSG